MDPKQRRQTIAAAVFLAATMLLLFAMTRYAHTFWPTTQFWSGERTVEDPPEPPPPPKQLTPPPGQPDRSEPAAFIAGHTPADRLLTNLFAWEALTRTAPDSYAKQRQELIARLGKQVADAEPWQQALAARTLAATLASTKADAGAQSLLDQFVGGLKKQQQADGNWPPAEQAPWPDFTTALAVETLGRYTGPVEVTEALERGRAYLIKQYFGAQSPQLPTLHPGRLSSLALALEAAGEDKAAQRLTVPLEGISERVLESDRFLMYHIGALLRRDLLGAGELNAATISRLAREMQILKGERAGQWPAGTGLSDGDAVLASALMLTAVAP